jgi:uncharacterized membrane protein
VKTQSAAIKETYSSPAPRRWQKIALWMLIGAATLSVTLYTEVPLLRQVKERAYISTIPWLFIPHMIGGVLALLSGPLQFSSRLRKRHLQFHRVLGRVYVVSVLVAAPLAMVLSNHHHAPGVTFFVLAICCQAGTWLIATVAAFVMARNGHIQQHREWMVRSYAVTLTFLGTRVLFPFRIGNRHSVASNAIEIILVTFLAILIPDIALNWRYLTTSRRHSTTANSRTNDRSIEDNRIATVHYPSSRIEVDQV